MYAQVVMFEDSPEDLEHGIHHVEEEVLPAMAEAKGLVGLWLVDRESGKRISVMLWEDDGAEMEAAMGRVGALREKYGDRVRPAPVSAGRYEVYGKVITI